MFIPNESKTLTINNNTLVLTKNDYLLDKTVNDFPVIILKKEAIDKIEIFLDLTILPYEKNNTTLLPNTILYNNTFTTSVVEHAFVKGMIKENKEVIVEGLGEANISNVSKEFAGYIGTMARKRAVSNAVIKYFTKYLMINEPENPFLTEFSFYSQTEWSNEKNTTQKTFSPPLKKLPHIQNSNSLINQNVQNPKDWVFEKGSYAGKSIETMNSENPNYLTWILENKNADPTYKTAISSIKQFLTQA